MHPHLRDYRTPRPTPASAPPTAVPPPLRIPLLVPLAISLLTLGCGPSAGSSGDADPPTDEAFASLENGRLVEELRVGGLDGPMETTFGSIGAIRPIPGGGFYIFDPQVPVIRRYDDEGAWVEDLGQGGEGPGEYGWVAALEPLRDGRTLVFDGRQGRVTVFGEVDGPRTYPAQIRSYGYDNRADRESGDLYAIVSPADGVFREGRDVSPGDWARVDLAGNVERLRPAPPENRDGPAFFLSGAQGSYPFSIRTFSKMGGGGDYWEMRNDEPRIRHLHPDGTETFIELEGEPIPLTAEEKAEWTRRGEQMWERMQNQPGMGGPGMPGRSDYVDIPEVKPYVREMIADSDGRLWVLRYGEPVFVPYSEEQAAERAAQNLPDHNWWDRMIWEVYDTDDRLLGRVEIPQKMGLYDAMGDRVYALMLGDYRENYAVRFRVDLPGFAEGGG